MLKNLAKHIALFLLSLYQQWAYLLGGKHCKFIPSCSEYAKEAVSRYGATKGTWLAMKRMAKCHPFSKGGVDLLK